MPPSIEGSPLKSPSTARSPRSARSVQSSRVSRETSPTMSSTPATSVPSPASKTKDEDMEDTPADGLVTKEMMKEEEELHDASQAESSSQVPPPHPSLYPGEYSVYGIYMHDTNRYRWW